MGGGVFSRDASARLTFALGQVSAAEYESLCAKIVTAFGLFPNTPRIDESDTSFQDFSQDEQLVGLEWDNWSGFRIVALTPTSEQSVCQIAAFLQEGCEGVV